MYPVERRERAIFERQDQIARADGGNHPVNSATLQKATDALNRIRLDIFAS